MREELDHELKTLLNQFFQRRFSYVSLPEDVWHPLTDVFETEKGLTVKMEVAGINPKDIQVILEGKKLIVQGVRHEIPGSRKISYHQMEISYGPFRKIINLPSWIDTKKIKSAYKNGFLEIELPYSKEASTELILINIE